MGKIDDYIEAVTWRLRPDAELHMDIAQEVRAHLEDAVEEAHARGLGEAECEQAALKAFGDQSEVGEGIWQANRRRMRLRAVVKWALRLTLVPAALLFTLYLCGMPFAVQALYSGKSAAADRARPRKGLTDEERFIFVHLCCDVDRARILVEKYPRNPVFYSDYTRLAFVDLFDGKETDPADVEQILAVLDGGESVEPDNAWYDYMKAGILLERSSHVVEGEGVEYEITTREGETKKRWSGKLAIDDRPAFQRGMREVLEGACKPACDPRSFDALELWLELQVPPATFPQQILLIAQAAGVIQSGLGIHREMTRRLPPYALLLASEGDLEAAAKLTDVMHRPVAQLGAKTETLIGILVANACMHISYAPAPAIYEELRMPREAEAARQRYRAEVDLWNSLWQKGRLDRNDERVRKHFGALMGLFAPSVPGFDESAWIPPFRRIEHNMTQRAMLGGFAVTFSLLVLVFGGFTCWNLWRLRKRGDAPKLFFVGWPRIGGIVALALVLPVGVYWAYTRLTPLSSLRYGINYCIGRIGLELALIFSVVVAAVLCMGYHAIRGRCRDAGMTVGLADAFNPFRSRTAKIVGGLLAAAVVLSFILWERDGMRTWGCGYVAGAVVLAALIYLTWQFWRLRGKDSAKAHFRRTFIRSVIPILAACLLAVGLVSHVSLRLEESARIRLLNQSGQRLYLDELEMTSLKHYRDHLREVNRKWNAAHGISKSP